MKLTTKKLIKNLNDRLLTQNIIVQTLIDIILENGLTTEEDLDIRIKSNIELLDEELNSFKNDETPTERVGFQYNGQIGEA
jgi:predicted nucleotidyltransferase